jgi:hypothetical protein
VKQSFSAHAHANGLGPRDLKMVEQRQDIPPTLSECEALGGIRGPSVPAQIGHYDAVAVRISGKDVAPIVADTHASVQEQERLTFPAHFVIHLESIQGDKRHIESI